MFSIKDTYYPEASVVKIIVDNTNKTIAYYFAGNVEKKETFVDATALNARVDELKAIFVEINGNLYDPRKIQTVKQNGKEVYYSILGNIAETEVFESADVAEEKVMAFAATHLEINGVYYNGITLRIVGKNEASFTVTYLFNGKDKITVTYANQTAFENAVKAVEDLNKSGKDESKVTKAPVFSVPAGVVIGGTQIELSCETEGADIYFTTDGTDPTFESQEYTNETVITVPQAGLTVKAIAVKLGLETSSIAGATYTVSESVGTFYKGWVLGDDAEVPTLDEDDILGMAGLETGEADSANSPNPNVYTAPEGITPDGGRIVWAYPAMFGKVSQFIDSLGEHAIDDSYTNVQVTVKGIPLEVYILTTSVTPNVGEEYPQVFVA